VGIIFCKGLGLARRRIVETSRSFYLGLAVGAAASLAAALLLAPKSGDELRAQLLHSLKALEDRFEQVYERVKQSASQLVEEKRSRLLTAVEAARQEMARAREEIEARFREEA
jgi:gas vesicle protein